MKKSMLVCYCSLLFNVVTMETKVKDLLTGCHFALDVSENTLDNG